MQHSNDLDSTASPLQQLAQALKAGDPDGISRSIQAGADVNGMLPNGFPVMKYATNETSIRLIVEHGGNLNALHDGLAWLHVAAMQDVNLVRLLLKYGADPNVIDRNGRSALFCAEAFKEIDAIRVLLEARANPNIHKCGGFTVLHEAVASRNFQIAELLVESGCEIDPVDDDDQTPLLVAIYMGGAEQLKSVRLLIGAGANVNLGRRSDGFCPIHFAAPLGVDLIKALVDAGADINLKNPMRPFRHRYRKELAK